MTRSLPRAPRPSWRTTRRIGQPDDRDKFNASDARFLGSPVDFVVFDGLAAGRVERIAFIEIKTGKVRLTPSECLVQEAIEERRVD